MGLTSGGTTVTFRSLKITTSARDACHTTLVWKKCIERFSDPALLPTAKPPLPGLLQL